MFQNNFEHCTHPIPTIDLKFTILEKLHSAPSHTADRYQLTNEFPDQINPAHDAITELIDKGYVETILGSNDIRLTVSGIDAYESEYQRRKEYADYRAEQTAHKRAEASQVVYDKKKQFYQDLLIAIGAPLIVSALTFLAEHLQEIINEIRSFLL